MLLVSTLPNKVKWEKATQPPSWNVEGLGLVTGVKGWTPTATTPSRLSSWSPVSIYSAAAKLSDHWEWNVID